MGVGEGRRGEKAEEREESRGQRRETCKTYCEEELRGRENKKKE